VSVINEQHYVQFTDTLSQVVTSNYCHVVHDPVASFSVDPMTTTVNTSVTMTVTLGDSFSGVIGSVAWYANSASSLYSGATAIHTNSSPGTDYVFQYSQSWSTASRYWLFARVTFTDPDIGERIVDIDGDTNYIVVAGDTFAITASDFSSADTAFDTNTTSKDLSVSVSGGIPRVAAETYYPYQFTWYRDATQLSQSNGSGTISTYTVSRADALTYYGASYHCEVSDWQNTLTSESAIFQVEDPTTYQTSYAPLSNNEFLPSEAIYATMRIENDVYQKTTNVQYVIRAYDPSTQILGIGKNVMNGTFAVDTTGSLSVATSLSNYTTISHYHVQPYVTRAMVEATKQLEIPLRTSLDATYSQWSGSLIGTASNPAPAISANWFLDCTATPNGYVRYATLNNEPSPCRSNLSVIILDFQFPSKNFGH
jgi:hypothetical protein